MNERLFAYYVHGRRCLVALRITVDDGTHYDTPVLVIGCGDELVVRLSTEGAGAMLTLDKATVTQPVCNCVACVMDRNTPITRPVEVPPPDPFRRPRSE